MGQLHPTSKQERGCEVIEDTDLHTGWMEEDPRSPAQRRLLFSPSLPLFCAPCAGPTFLCETIYRNLIRPQETVESNGGEKRERKKRSLAIDGGGTGKRREEKPLLPLFLPSFLPWSFLKGCMHAGSIFKVRISFSPRLASAGKCTKCTKKRPANATTYTILNREGSEVK